VYELTQWFYLFQPEIRWSIPSVAVPYLVLKGEGVKPVKATATSYMTEFIVFPHSAAEGEVLMPRPDPYALPDITKRFIAPAVTPDAPANDHPFSAYVARWGENKLRLSVVSLALFAALLLGIGSTLLLRAKRTLERAKPQPYPFMSRDDLNASLKQIAKSEDGEAALRHLEQVASRLLASRFAGLSEDSVTVNAIKIALGREGDPRDLATELFERFSVIDAPRTASFAKNNGTRDELINKLVKLYDVLERMPPRMTEGGGDGIPILRYR
jgi:hypothetical protein